MVFFRNAVTWEHVVDAGFLKNHIRITHELWNKIDLPSKVKVYSKKLVIQCTAG
jgi:hypothetical protein